MKEQPKRQLRVVWQSNATYAPSGYGQQTADIKQMFLKSGWDGSNFALINMFGSTGGIFADKDGILNYPLMDHIVGSDAMLHHGKQFNADVIFALQDIWTLNPQDLQQVSRFIPWVPVDFDPVPKAILNNLRFANRIISMSKFGQKQLQDHGLSSTYIPHHVDTSVFFPLDKKKRKIEVKIDPNMFVIGMVAANKDLIPRKSFGHVLIAFKRFHDAHPNSLLYIHTDPDQPGGYPLRGHADYLGLTQAIGFPDKYRMKFHTPKSEMNAIYGAMDLLVAPSSTEGFMIPGIEAQATGTPIIVNDYTSMPELIIEGKTGFMTKLSKDCQHFMPIGGYMKFPDVDDLYEKMQLAFRSNLIEMGKAGRKFVMDNYSLDKVWAEKWLPFVERIENELYPKPLLTPPQKKSNI